MKSIICSPSSGTSALCSRPQFQVHLHLANVHKCCQTTTTARTIHQWRKAPPIPIRLAKTCDSPDEKLLLKYYWFHCKTHPHSHSRHINQCRFQQLCSIQLPSGTGINTRSALRNRTCIPSHLPHVTNSVTWKQGGLSDPPYLGCQTQAKGLRPFDSPLNSWWLFSMSECVVIIES